MPNFLFLSAVFGFLAVALGAFGAHGLKNHFDDYQMSVFRTGVDYQFYHSLALGLVACLLRNFPMPLFKASAILFVVGMVVFSGSLYLLAFTKIRLLGAITPIGGLCFLAGWACLAIGSLGLKN